MTRNIHTFLRTACFVRCRHHSHHERGYTLKHHKLEGIIQVWFNSFELLDEAEKVLRTEGLELKITLADQSNGCFLSLDC
ncbi:MULTISPECIES: hypothetical protein [unclassified Microcoleus]|uniref:hypothetical protein n=1 Tax=unclassified Microcoleus TaxID=2642155 RepID=UPI002FCFABD2